LDNLRLVNLPGAPSDLTRGTTSCPATTTSPGSRGSANAAGGVRAAGGVTTSVLSGARGPPGECAPSRRPMRD
jgi:hypothetical protein